MNPDLLVTLIKNYVLFIKRWDKFFYTIEKEKINAIIYG